MVRDPVGDVHAVEVEPLAVSPLIASVAALLVEHLDAPAQYHYEPSEP